eukprot:TRINITY_DN22294_c0_g1_i1.p1 TRINITY_DN22294_c0_g1~~TRINITY_DN22294_c0_g1_i1.p1  ORF type:complete len:521 (+),score=99.08 TRINITY_DN22294_c0_g1_i1:60-1622(+)
MVVLLLIVVAMMLQVEGAVNGTEGKRVVGYAERCLLYSTRDKCVNDVSCFWCIQSGQCMGKSRVIKNNTLLLSSCLTISTTWGQTCNGVLCDECKGKECLYKQCGLPDGVVDGNPTEDSCDAASTACYWCLGLNNEGKCDVKVKDCTEVRNDHLGDCKTITCVDNNEYDGALLEYEEKKSVMLVRIIASSLSLLGSLFIIVSIVLFKRYHFMSSRLILALGICSLLESLNSFLSLWIFHDELQLWSLCKFQGMTHQFSSIATTGWVTVIAINLYLAVCRNVTNKKVEIAYHVCVWGMALLSTLIPLSTPNAYGIAGLWCWLNWSTGQIWRWVLYFIPLLLSTSVILFLYLLIAYHIRKHADQHPINEASDQSDEDSEEIDFTKEEEKATLKFRKSDQEQTPKKHSDVNILRKLAFYPLIHLLCYAGSITNRFYDAISLDDSFGLYIFEAATLPLNGFLWGIGFWVWDTEIRQSWKDLFSHLLGRPAHEQPDQFQEDQEDIDDQLQIDDDLSEEEHNFLVH